VFLSCSRSEGWNLPLCEAMACGIPSIYSNCSGQLEFAKSKGHPVKILGEKQIPNGYGNYYEPDFNDLSNVMRDVYINYWEYKNVALKESEIIRKDFSWKNATNIALNILDDVYKTKKNK
jgi:glycosyltransferase involved in cell wall biosynthesis